jgi:predicted transposase YdaD
MMLLSNEQRGGGIPLMSKKSETGLEHKQPYDTTFKSLLDDVTLALLSFLFGERIIFAQELKESLFKQDTIEPGLRVDCAYHMLSRDREEAGIVVGHVEIESAPTADIVARLFEYAGLLYHKYLTTIVQVLVCPFETSALPKSLLELKWGKEVLTAHRYRVVALWLQDARELVEQGLVELYALLPTMRGATYELLVQALRDMRAFHADESRLRRHLMWFDALLGRTTTVTQEDKRRVRHAMVNEFRSLLDEGYFVQMRVAESRQEALAEGLAQGEAKGREEGREEGLEEGLTEALLMVTELRFPTLLELAEQRARQAKRSGDLRLVLKGVKNASSEEAARNILDLLAA